MRSRFLDRKMGQSLSVDVNHKQRNAQGFTFDLIEPLRTRDHEHLVGIGYCGDPDLAPVKAPAFTVTRRKCSNRRRVYPSVRFRQRHAEPALPRYQLGKQLLPQDRKSTRLNYSP